MKIKGMLCLDMDGTIADLYAVDNWLLKITAGQEVNPYLEARPIYKMEVLNAVLQDLINDGWEIRIISWTAKGGTPAYNKAVAQAKKLWLEKYEVPCHKTHIVKYGTKKDSVIKKSDKFAILIDDDEKVRQTWAAGIAIDPNDLDLITFLRELLNY